MTFERIFARGYEYATGFVEFLQDGVVALQIERSALRTELEALHTELGTLRTELAAAHAERMVNALEPDEDSRPEHLRDVVLKLSHYERDNLGWLLKETRHTHCTGDWHHQIRSALKPELGEGDPNWAESALTTRVTPLVMRGLRMWRAAAVALSDMTGVHAAVRWLEALEKQSATKESGT